MPPLGAVERVDQVPHLGPHVFGAALLQDVLHVEADEERHAAPEALGDGFLIHGVLLDGVEDRHAGVDEVVEGLGIVTATVQPEVHAVFAAQVADARVAGLEELGEVAGLHHELPLVAEIVAGPEAVRLELGDRPADVALVERAQAVEQAMDFLRVKVVVHHQAFHAPQRPRPLEDKPPPAEQQVAILSSHVLDMFLHVVRKHARPVGVRQLVEELVQVLPVRNTGVGIVPAAGAPAM